MVQDDNEVSGGDRQEELGMNRKSEGLILMRKKEREMVLARQKDEGKKCDIPLTLTASLESMGTAALSFSVY